MPSTSPAQARLMAAAAHTAGGFGGVPQSVGREFNQADMALRHAHEHARQHRASGGPGGYMPPNLPFFTRQDLRGETAPLPSGLIHSPVAGRTDQLPISPAAGSYVLPADVVSGLGEGNTLAGAAVIDRMLGSEPYGIRPPPHHGGRADLPRPPRPETFRSGGRVARTGNVIHYAFGGGIRRYAYGGKVIETQPGHDPHEGHPGSVPIIAAGGEYIIPPHQVAYHSKLGMGDPLNPDPRHRTAALRRGHQILDGFVKSVRAKTVKDLKNLPGPAK